MISSKATDVLSFSIFKWSVITSSLIKKTIKPFLNTEHKDASPPPPKKKTKTKRKQNKIQLPSNMRYFWIVYRFCCDKRCKNEQCNIIDTKCSPLPLLYTLIEVLNSKGIMICARLKLCGGNSKSFCSSQDLSLFILPCRMRQIKELKALLKTSKRKCQ